MVLSIEYFVAYIDGRGISMNDYQGEFDQNFILFGIAYAEGYKFSRVSKELL
jgi:hypothetical protein